MDWTYRLRVRHLDWLLGLAQTRNLSRSADLLNTTQPALSKWLKELEVDLGLPLFDRHARGLSPTRYGDVLMEHARRISIHLNTMRDDLAAMRDGGSGRIVIGTSGASVGSVAPEAVLRLVRDYPKSLVELVESPLDRLTERLIDGELDIVVGRPMVNAARAGLFTETLYADPIEVIARPDHPLFERGALNWKDLLDYRWIVWPKGTPARAALEAALLRSGHDMPSVAVQCGTATLNLALVTRSDMICFASRADAYRYRDWNIARVVPISMLSFGEVAMHWRNDGDSRPILSAMLSALRAVAAEKAKSTNGSLPGPK